ncbi:exonuclease SbcCD subunit D, partial [Streptomyces sp. SID625]|nr:exonuclease SbcCD subunit D [Streptomyces sp. SID625]
AAHRKSMWLVDLDAAGTVTAERVDCPVPRPLARIRGSLEDLLADPDLARHEDSWVEATLTDTVRPADPMARLAARFPHTLSLVFAPERAPDDPDVSYARRLAGRSDEQIARDFVAHV